MKFRAYTDDDGNERISARGTLDELGLDGINRDPEPGERIGVVESTDVKDDGLYATIRVDSEDD